MATLPRGLGLTPERFWGLTWADYHALTKANEQIEQGTWNRWALERADFRNLHFRGDSDTLWVPGDFLGTANREERKLEELGDRLEVRKLNTELQAMKKGDTTGVPAFFLAIEKNQAAIRAKSEERNKTRTVIHIAPEAAQVSTKAVVDV